MLSLIDGFLPLALPPRAGSARRSFPGPRSRGRESAPFETGGGEFAPTHVGGYEGWDRRAVKRQPFSLTPSLSRWERGETDAAWEQRRALGVAALIGVSTHGSQAP